MEYVLITPPSGTVLAVEDCKTMLGITGSDQDDMLEAAIAGVVGMLDPSTKGYLGSAIATQTWELRTNGFYDEDIFHHRWHPAIELRFPPLQSITSITYDDQNGDAQTLNSDAYRVFGVGSLSKGRVAPAFGQAWPTTRFDLESVRIRFVCGYADDKIPGAIKSAVALGARVVMSNAEQNLYLSSQNVEGVETRTWVVSASANSVIQQAIDNLLAGHRVPE